MIGKILGGRYELLEKIGQGGMAVVYRAKCLLLNRTVAVKILRDDLDSSDEFIKRFNIEAQSAASLTSPNIVSIYDVGIDGDTNFIVMEYVEGQTLKEYIKYNSPIDWQKAVKIAMKISNALSEAHKKHIIHRDIKPQNIIITEDGDIKVTDFGIARVSSGATISADEDVIGSVHYISPEQARGGYVDERSDIYSLGVVMYEMLTGKVPFNGDTPVSVAIKQIEQDPVPPCEVIEDIPENVSSIVLKAMSKEINNRYSTVSELSQDLNSVLADPASVIIEPKTNQDYLDEITKKIPALKLEHDIVEAGNESASKKTGKKISSSDKKTVVSAVATSLIIVLLLSLFAANIIFPEFKPFAFLSSFSNQEVEVPDLLNLSVDEAEQRIKDTDFSIVVKESKKSTDAEPGTIIEQYPKGGRIVKGAQSIDVTIAKGAESITLKDYSNKEVNIAEIELKALGINVIIERTTSETIAKDYVVSQYPSEGHAVKEGTSVTLYVSDGMEDVPVTVPKLLGMTRAEAKRRIEQENLVMGDFERKASSEPKDTVIEQSIAGGETVEAKTVINLVVSNGEGNSGNDSGATSNNSSTVSDKPTSQNKEKTLYITLPDDKDKINVKITSNGSVVYEGTHNPKKNSVFEKKVYGTGTVAFEIYLDGVKVASQNVNFGN
ncbi:MAG: Stk1 family PASTA domain-containing Ser/Thr kinase [Ruminococcaceae bacterium]|nr:Stk1 family PASTA domain-containing Ser/Thr kinase [Oscillospiraceae bacterium]